MVLYLAPGIDRMRPLPPLALRGALPAAIAALIESRSVDLIGIFSSREIYMSNYRRFVCPSGKKKSIPDSMAS